MTKSGQPPKSFTTETRVVRKNRSAGVSPASEPRQLLLGQHDLCRLEAGDTFFLTPTEKGVWSSGFRVCEEIIWTPWHERRAGRCEAPRRRRCRTSSRSGNKADARPPPRPSGLRPAGPLGLFVAPHIPLRL